MSATRIRVQLQQGHTNHSSDWIVRHGITYWDVVTEIRNLHIKTKKFFPRRNDRERYRQAVEKLVKKLERAMTGGFQVQTAGNQFREEFQATREGKTSIYRIDVEIKGTLAVR